MNRRLRRDEYEDVRSHFDSLGFEEGFAQRLSSASRDFTPDFDWKGV
jgi:hypothetical protein